MFTSSLETGETADDSGAASRRGTTPSDPETDLSDTTLLVVADRYNNFVKEPTDILAESFEKVYVAVRYHPLAGISNYLDIDYLRPFRKEAKINRSRMPDNVEIVETPLYFVPIDIHRRYLGKQHYLTLAWRARRVADEIDLVHSHLTWTAGYAGQRLADRCDVPHVLTIHENSEWFERLREGRFQARSVWRDADHLIRVNRQDLDALSEFNDSVSYVPNGFNPDLFPSTSRAEARSQLGLSESTQVLFSLGTLKERKGFHNVIEVLPELEDLDVEYYVGGQGPQFSRLQDLAAERGVDDSVHLLDFVPEDEVKYWMNAADLFVLPSYSESFGVVALEAMACGTPVVTTRNGGTEEVVTSDTGVLVDSPEAHDDLERAIRQSLERDWDQQAIREYAEGFTWQSVADELRDVYARVLSARE